MSQGGWTIFRWECDCFASGARLNTFVTWSPEEAEKNIHFGCQICGQSVWRGV